MNKDLLQPFTLFGNLLNSLVAKTKPAEELQVQERQSDQIHDDSSEGIQDILMMRLASEYSDEMVLNEETPDLEENRTIQFQRNQNILKKAIAAYIAAHGNLPTTSTLAKITGFSRPTIQSHLKDDVLNLFFKQELSKLQILSSDLLAKVYQMAQNGDLRAIKMLFDTMLTVQKFRGSTQNNFIQINNLRVENRNLEKLSQKAKIKIEKIIRGDLRLNK